MVERLFNEHRDKGSGLSHEHADELAAALARHLEDFSPRLCSAELKPSTICWVASARPADGSRPEVLDMMATQTFVGCLVGRHAKECRAQVCGAGF